MARLQIRSDADVFDDLRNRVAARAGLTDITQASSWGQVLWAIALEFGESYYQLTNLRNLFDLTTASGSDLDEVAKTVVPGLLTRLPARRAIGEVVISRATDTGSTGVVNAGQIVQDATGTRFVTLEAGVVLAGGAEIVAGHGTGRDAGPILARAIEPGIAGNVASGEVTAFSSRPSGFTSVTNLTAFTGGAELESDDSFRARLRTYIASLSRCTPEAIESILLGTSDPVTGKDVRFVRVVEDPIDRGNFIVYIDDGAGTASETISTNTSGAVDSFTGPGGAGTYTLKSTTPTFREDMVDAVLTLTGSSYSANNITPDFATGRGRVLSVVDSRTITYSATSASTDTAQPAPTSWNIQHSFPVSPWGSGAVGGEQYLQLSLYPIDESTITVISREASGYSLYRGTLTRGSEFYVNPASGVLYMDPPLASAEYLEVDFDAFTGLVGYVQKIVDGDPSDRENFPGLRAAGVRAQVLSPTRRVITVEAKIQVLSGYVQSDVLSAVRTAVTEYINNLGISEDVVRHEIIERIMAVRGTYDVVLLAPTENVIVLDSEIARVTSSSLIIS